MSLDHYSQYFPELTSDQKEKLLQLEALYLEWNEKINVVSRKDTANIGLRHICHSLSLTKLVQFRPLTSVLDVGTGGGLPGLPLAILYPHVRFTLVDSIEKKIRVVTEISNALQLENVTPVKGRVENVDGNFDYVVSRAVARVNKIMPWLAGKLHVTDTGEINGGIYLLKGGDELDEELKEANQPGKIHDIHSFIQDPFFETKKIVAISKVSPRYL